MKKKYPVQVWLIFLCVITSRSEAQAVRYSISMPYVTLGAYSFKQKDPFAFTGNQAALAGAKVSSAGVFGERRFLLAETSVYGVAAVLPTAKGNFGLQVNYAGFANFNENKLGVAYGRKLGKALDIGVQFNYYGYSVSQYGNASSINFEIGALLHFSEKFHGGIHVYNPLGGKLGKADAEEQLASAYKLGLGYDASDNFYVSTEIVKEEDKPVNVVGGVQYHFARQFFARAGFISETGSGYGGVGLGWKNFRLDIAANYHPQLGISPGLLLIVNFKESEQ